MCKPASFVLTKDRVFWSDKTDSHEDIISEFSLCESGTHGVNILRVEISPENSDMRIPLDNWVFRYDQDLLPKWADKETDEKRTRQTLLEWAEKRLLINRNATIKDQNIFVYGNSQVTAWGNSQVTAWGNSQVTARDNSQVTAWGNSQVTAWGNSQVTARGNSQVKARGNSQVTAWDNSQVTARDNSYVTARDNSQVTAWGNSIAREYDNANAILWECAICIKYENNKPIVTTA